MFVLHTFQEEKNYSKPSKFTAKIFCTLFCIFCLSPPQIFYICALSYDVHDLWSSLNFQIFLDFAGNTRAQNPNKAQKKRVNITGVKYFRLYQYVVSNSSFILYPLLILLTHYLQQLLEI